MKELKTILIVEDEENDVFFLQRAFHATGFTGIFRVCPNAPCAISYLMNRPPYEDRHENPSPQLVITDLKMAGGSGFALLHWLKDNPNYMVIPVIVLTSSVQDSDVKEAYCLGANGYIMKPNAMNDLQVILRHLIDFWRDCEKPEPGVHSPCTDEANAAASEP